MMNNSHVKLEPPDFHEKYRASIVPSIREALRRPSALQDITVECGDGEQVATSVVLLAAISPWLRCLLEGAGEGTGLCLPDVTGPQLTAYLESCLTPAVQHQEGGAAIHELLVPSWWHQGEGEGVKVEVDLPDNINGDMEDIDDSEEEGEANTSIPMKTDGSVVDMKEVKPVIGEPEKQKQEPYRCRYDPTCVIPFRSTKVRIEHERAKHGALYLAPMEKPYTIVKGETSVCRQCGFSTQDSLEFLEHLRRHQVEGFQCECPGVPLAGVEGEPITREFMVKERHIRVHHLGWIGCTDTNKETGEECLFMCESKKEIEEHIMKNHTERKAAMGRKKTAQPTVKNLLCPDCGKEFPPRAKNGQSGRVEYEKHLFWHKVEEFSCDCPDVPKLTMRLGQVRKRNIDWRHKERHIKVHHMGWHGCTEHGCLLSCETKELLDEHIQKHALSYMCDLCGFKADNSDKLRWHTKVMHESVMVPCPDCGKILKDKYLRLHRRKVHMASACEICGVVVKNVKHHMQSMHMADSDKRFHCQECGKGFMCKVTMENHRMNMHIKTQPYQCRYGCENRYNDTSNRSAHERRRHGGVFPGP